MKTTIKTVTMCFLAAVLSGCNEKLEMPSGQEEQFHPHRYYIDQDAGRYYNTGHSESLAWESMDRINDYVWNPGDTILIKRGTSWDGTLQLRGSGTPEAPIVICAYGDENLPKPVINACGQSETVLIENVQYWELHDLHVTNKGTEENANRVGIRIIADEIEGGVMRHIHIVDCEVSDVYGTKCNHSVDGGGAAIFYHNKISAVQASAFDGLLIEGCHLYDCQRNGINGYIDTGERSKRKASKNVVFRNNLIENIPGDLILVNGCDDALVEGNVIRNCAKGDFDEANGTEAAAALWCMHSDGTVFRYNVVQDHRATWDGMAFDCDQNCVNTLFEYNISSGNEGGWLMLCPSDVEFNNGYAEHKGTIARYNVSINDGTRNYKKQNGKNHSPLLDICGRVAGCHIYNNTFIKTVSATENCDNVFMAFNSFTNIPNALHLSNNIIYNTTTEANDFYKITAGKFVDDCGLVLENNCIFGYREGTIPGDAEHNRNTVVADPGFVDLLAAFIDSEGNLDKDEILKGLALASDSPCLGTGKAVASDFFPIGNDFWGKSLGDKWNIGAYNH